jgi:hypothetical protein
MQWSIWLQRWNQALQDCNLLTDAIFWKWIQSKVMCCNQVFESDILHPANAGCFPLHQPELPMA